MNHHQFGELIHDPKNLIYLRAT